MLVHALSTTSKMAQVNRGKHSHTGMQTYLGEGFDFRICPSLGRFPGHWTVAFVMTAIVGLPNVVLLCGL